ncbi:MAG: cytochrome c3 family protein [Acidobacteriota bacterium]
MRGRFGTAPAAGRLAPNRSLIPGRLLRSWLLAALVAAGVGTAWQDARAQEENCASEKCHATLIVGKSVHKVAETCEECHESTATPHPQKGVKTFKLADPLPELCLGCHEGVGKKSQVHAPVKEGKCTTCHDPHSSGERRLLRKPMKELCKDCHADHVDFDVVHGPVATGECTACHVPHDGDDKTLLRKPGDGVCLGCHEDIAAVLTKAYRHTALKTGCTSCHNPHGSEYPKLLANVGREVCLDCHDDVAEKADQSASPHPPVKDPNGCASCHSPHASDNAKLLQKPMKETCLGCHGTILTKTMTFLHGPINDGKCSACHDPHGSPNAKLLVKEFPAGPYVPYTDTEFALCFSCHKRDAVQYPETSFATNFRDGEKNLHFVHVNNTQKARSCTLCHDIHGGGNSVLVAESVPFGKWNLPLKFVKTETGGGCSPGCHKPRYYDRKTPGRKPQTEAPARG